MNSSNSQLTPDQIRSRVEELRSAGRLHEAIALQVQLVNDGIKRGAIAPDDYQLLGTMLFTAKDWNTAVQVFSILKRHQPDFPGVDLNLGLSLLRAHRLEEARAALQAAELDRAEDLNLLDGLADLYGKLGNLERARHYGERSLLQKDRLAQTPFAAIDFANIPIPPFEMCGQKANIIAFSLFGRVEMYQRGAIANATAAPHLYPGWRCRFYVDDTVPSDTCAALTHAGAEVVMMERHQRSTDGLFWRFLVAEDPNVTRFLIRDCDSVINIRERLAVGEWLDSHCHFHIMRDCTSHTDLVLAGMWGGVSGILPPLARLLEGFSYKTLTESRVADQIFLGRIVWPLIKPSCSIHDRLYRVFGSRDFPAGAELLPGHHVGENVSNN
ncbi:tetratricopeptide repeat protein [Pseudanabaena sp. PCC 6802]|uniref:tetratricopeptide repeat protein n=1 Tax=Pseudanabaena sp. PCC 6802 TaxID=118173 RepID=UPI00034DAF7A|nr:tetratricopeptide repeat protein [Pseudanabaena sp. PCC 6802]